MAGASQDQIDEWVTVIAQLHDYVTRDPRDARTATQEAAYLWSEFGWSEAPPEIIDMIMHSIEAGYAQALRDVRDGRHDGRLAMWRPELIRGGQ